MPTGVFEPADSDEPSEAKDRKDFADDLARLAGTSAAEARENPKGLKALVERMSDNIGRGAARRAGKDK